MTVAATVGHAGKVATRPYLPAVPKSPHPTALALAVALLLAGPACTPRPTLDRSSDPNPNATSPTTVPGLGQDDDPPAAGLPGDPAAVIPDAQMLVGLYREEGGRQLFVPCGSPSETYEIVEPDADLTVRYTDATMQGYPGQPVVLELVGALRPDAAARPDRNGELVVARVSRMRAKNPRNTCVPYDFWALGNEPFWSLQVSAAEGVAEFSRLGASTVRLGYAPPSLEDDGRVTRYFFPGEQRLKVTFTEEPCTDTMAGNPYGYTAVIEFAGATYRGCGQRPPTK